MLKCLFIRKKLYDYFDNCLSDIDRIKVKAHLDSCGKCRENLEQIRNIIDLAAQKKTPCPSEEFWHNFKVGLDRKLNQKLVPKFAFGGRLIFNLKPAFAYALALVFILVIGSRITNKDYRFVRMFAQSDEELVEEMALLDEVDQTQDLTQDKDSSYNEEIELLYQLDQTLT